MLEDVSFTARQGRSPLSSAPLRRREVHRLQAGRPVLGCHRREGVPGRNGRVHGGPGGPLLRSYSMVFQDVVLFRDTVMENIRLGRRSATDGEVLEAAKAAQCDEFIRKLPQGYQTVIGGERFHPLRRERQRISIARALLEGRAGGAAG